MLLQGFLLVMAPRRIAVRVGIRVPVEGSDKHSYKGSC